MAPITTPEEVNLDVQATAISMINSELTLNKTTILASNSETSVAGIVITKLESEIIITIIIISKDNRKMTNVDHRLTTRTLKEYRPDSAGKTVRVRTKDRLFRHRKANKWYEWVEFTGNQIKAKDCYLCNANRQEALYVTNTKYSWKLCGEEYSQQVKKRKLREQAEPNKT